MTYFYQSETAECGLACIAVALDQFGAPVDMAELRRKFVVSSRGTSVKDLIEIATTLGLVGRAVRCELSEIVDLKTPSILHWGLNHFVVLRKVKSNFAHIYDPAIGHRKLKISALSDHFTGIAIELSTAPDFQKRKKESPLSLWSWFRLEPSLYGSLFKILLLSIVMQVYVLASPFYMQLAIDSAALKGDKQLLTALALGFGLFAFFNLSANLMRDFVTLKLTALLNWDMTLRLFRHLIRLPLPWFQRRKLADVLSRFDAIGPVRQLISGTLVATFVDGILAVFTLMMMVFFAPQLATVVLIGFVFYVAISVGSLPLSIKLGMESLSANITENGKRIETIRAIQTIKSMGAEGQRESDWANKFARSIQRDLASSKLKLYTNTLHAFVNTSVNMSIIYFGAKAVIEGNMTVGLLYAFLSYSTQFFARASAIFDQLMHWRLTDMYSYRLADIVLTPKETGIDDAASQPDVVGEIEFINLSFGYSPRDPLIFKNLTVKVNPGEFVAIVGPSGAGKSTLLKVLCGLYPATTGEVRIDGRSLISWGPRSTRASFGVVMQDDEILSGTIAENVAFFDEQIDVDRVWFALKQACLDEDVIRMPMRLETYLGDMGSTLSGGQKQRLLLARALYKQPKILILDEATSHLDLARESSINASLRSLSITRIIVAHRQETIAAADRVIALDRGTIVFDREINQKDKEC